MTGARPWSSARHVEGREFDELASEVCGDRQLSTTSRASSQLLPADALADAVGELKAQHGKDLAVFAGATVAQTF